VGYFLAKSALRDWWDVILYSLAHVDPAAASPFPARLAGNVARAVERVFDRTVLARIAAVAALIGLLSHRPFLRKCGYRVEECANGRVAVAALRVHRFDAVVSDLRMPDLSGEELFEVVRRERPELVERFVLTSGDLLRRGTQQFVQEAGCLFLEKPYELTDLLHGVHLIAVEGRLDQEQLRIAQAIFYGADDRF
jgi:CheY-like chemotaxis protein